MKKNLSFLSAVVISGNLFFPVKAQAQGVANTPFVGHTYGEVVVKPADATADRQTITVSKNAAYDGQVVYLYHPKTGRFLYPEGFCGTMAVVRYEGFGMPVNIVDPTGVDGYGTGTVNDGLGIYSESSNEGHYLGRPWSMNWPGDVEVFYDESGNAIGSDRFPPFYTDRGGSNGDDWNTTLYCQANQAKQDDVFTWKFEEKVIDGKTFYLLSVGTQTEGTNTTDTRYRRYIKVANTRLFPIGATDYYVTTDSKTEQDDTYVAHENDEDYYWQIVTRADIKKKFREDNRNPYINERVLQSGNATFLIDDPDFSRPFYQKVDVSGTNPFWEISVNNLRNETKADEEIWSNTYNQRFVHPDNKESKPYGRYFFMQPLRSGYAKQSFSPQQFGLYRIDFQGFDIGDNTSNLTLSGGDGLKFSPTTTFLKKGWGDVGVSEEDFNRMVIDELSLVSPSTLTAGTGSAANASDWNITPPSGTVEPTQGTDVVNVTIPRNTKGVYVIECKDKFGRTAVGVYVAGQNGGWTAPGNNAYYYNSGSGWQTEQNFTVNPGTSIQFGPTDVQGGGTYHWYGPNGFRSTGREFTKSFASVDAGDYICVYEKDNQYAVFNYNIKVNGSPDPSRVKLNGDNPFKIDNGEGDITLALTQTLGNNQGETSYETFINDYTTVFNNIITGHSWTYRNRLVSQYFFDHPDDLVQSAFVYVPEDKVNSDVTLTFNFDVASSGDAATNYERNYTALDNVRITYLGDVPFVLDEDGNSYNYISSADRAWVPVYMNRDFAEGCWQALVCPVPLTAAQVKKAFGNGTMLSVISTAGLDPQDPYRIVFESVSLLNDDDIVVNPGSFYIIKPSNVEYTQNVYQYDDTQVYEFTTSGKLVPLGFHNLKSSSSTETISSDDGTATSHAMEKSLAESCLGTYYTINQQDLEHNSVQFHGSYITQTIPSANVANSYVFAHNASTGVSALFHLTEASGDFPLKGFRFYIQDIPAVGTSTSASGSMRWFNGFEDIYVDGPSEGEATGVEEIHSGKTATGGAVYNVFGQQVKAGREHRGIYVKNGRKMFVK